jgi:hypothetical protein
MKDTLSLKQAANYLGVHVWHMKKLLYYGQIPSRNNGKGSFTVRKLDLDYYRMKCPPKTP